MTRGRIWFACPSYTDIPAFLMLRTRILEVIEGDPLLRGLEARFVVIDDSAGGDEEIALVDGYDDVQVVTPPFNLGHQRAIVCGLRSLQRSVADEDIIVTMDADGEDRPEDLPRMLKPVLESPADQRLLSIAQRTRRQETFRFRAMYLLFRVMFRVLTGATIRSGNFAAYRGAVARRMLLHPYFDLCYSSTLVTLDIPVTYVPCPRGKRYAGQSRMNLLRLLMHGVRMLMPFTERIAVRALAAFGALFGVGVILALVVIGIKVFTSAAIPGWATDALLGTIIVSLLALGNFVVLFVVFSHSRGISLAGLEEQLDRPA